MALLSDGTFFVVAGFQTTANRIRRVGLAVPGLSNTDSTVASRDGSELYVFDSSGRHLRTLNTLTGAILVEFGYDSAGRLSTITEKTGGTDNITTIQHDSSGNPTKMIGPFGQETLFSVDANGFLATITNPAGEMVQLGSTADGLLTSFTDPRGKTSSFSYDGSGHLMHDGDAVGGTEDLVQTLDSPTSFTVTRTTALSRTTSYKTENLDGNVQKRTITAPDGTQNLSQESIDAGATTLTDADGTVANIQLGPDSRFGMEAPIENTVSITLPSNLTLTGSETQTVTLSNPTDPLSLVSLAGTSTISGRTFTSTYTASTKTFVTSTPEGRTSSFTIDTLGRMVSGQVSGLNGASMTYDANGRLATLTRGSGPSARSITFTYNSAGFVSSITDAIGRTAQFNDDAAGRVTNKVFPDSRTIDLTYDAAGNLATITPPGRPTTSFSYSDRDELTQYNPPSAAGSGPTNYTNNLDKQLTASSGPITEALLSATTAPADGRHATY